MISTRLGQRVINAFEKSCPLSLKGEPIRPDSCIFTTKNPYILESLPDFMLTNEGIKNLSILEGKTLSKAGRFLDSHGSNPETFSQAINRYLRLFHNKRTVGFNEKEINLLYNKAFPNVKIPSNVNEDAFLHLNRLSRETGSQFDAHGMAKVGVGDQLKQLNTLLSNGIDKTKPFCTAPLVSKHAGVGAGLGTGGGHAYRDGSFILVGEKGQKIIDSQIKHVIVNDAYYNIIDDLAKKFPEINFVKAESAPEYFERIATI